jgi:hypothetical protein
LHPFTLLEEELKSTTIHYWYADGMSEPVAQDEIVNGDQWEPSEKKRRALSGDQRYKSTSSPNTSTR